MDRAVLELAALAMCEPSPKVNARCAAIESAVRGASLDDVRHAARSLLAMAWSLEAKSKRVDASQRVVRIIERLLPRLGIALTGKADVRLDEIRKHLETQQLAPTQPTARALDSHRTLGVSLRSNKSTRSPTGAR